MSNDEPQSLRDVAEAAVLRNDGVRGRGLKRVAEKQGLTLSYTTVDKILDGTYKSTPTRKTLDALVKLSGYTKEQVYRAAQVPMPLKPLRDDLPDDADLLDGHQRRVVIDTIRLFAQQNKSLAAMRAEQEGGEGNAGSTPSTSTTGSGPDRDLTSRVVTDDEVFVALTDRLIESDGDPVRAQAALVAGFLHEGSTIDGALFRAVLERLQALIDQAKGGGGDAYDARSLVADHLRAADGDIGRANMTLISAMQNGQLSRAEFMEAAAVVTAMLYPERTPRDRAEVDELLEAYLERTDRDAEKAMSALHADFFHRSTIDIDLFQQVSRRLAEMRKAPSATVLSGSFARGTRLADAARDVGRKGSVQKAREEQDQVGQGSQDDGGMDPL